MVLFAMFMSLNAQNLTKSNPANDFWTIIEPPLPNSGVRSLTEDKQGNIVVALGDRKGVFTSKDEGITWDSLGLSGVYIYRLYQNFDGRLFATSGAYHGLYVLEEGSTGWIGIPNPGKDNITAILGTEDTTLFIGGWEGIYKIKTGIIIHGNMLSNLKAVLPKLKILLMWETVSFWQVSLII